MAGFSEQEVLREHQDHRRVFRQYQTQNASYQKLLWLVKRKNNDPTSDLADFCLARIL